MSIIAFIATCILLALVIYAGLAFLFKIALKRQIKKYRSMLREDAEENMKAAGFVRSENPGGFDWRKDFLQKRFDDEFSKLSLDELRTRKFIRMGTNAALAKMVERRKRMRVVK